MEASRCVPGGTISRIRATCGRFWPEPQKSCPRLPPSPPGKMRSEPCTTVERTVASCPAPMQLGELWESCSSRLTCLALNPKALKPLPPNLQSKDSDAETEELDEARQAIPLAPCFARSAHQLRKSATTLCLMRIVPRQEESIKGEAEVMRKKLRLLCDKVAAG